MSGILEPRIDEIMGNNYSKILKYTNLKINENFPKHNYREFLRLIIIKLLEEFYKITTKKKK